jgi:hypothetical protein
MTDDRPLEGHLLALVRAKDEFNALIRGFRQTGRGPADPLSVRLPELRHPELGFWQSVAWLYALYYEVVKVDSVFLCAKLEAYELDADHAAREHRARVGRLRTYLQHNLDYTREHDRETRRACESWFHTACGTRVPNSDEAWRGCLARLLEDAVAFLALLTEAVRRIEQDDAHEQIRDEWVRRVDRHHEPQEFDALISITARDMGRDGINVIELRRRFYDKWITTLRFLADDYVFEKEARRLIEHAILNEAAPGLPITGEDMLQAFDIEPGPEVGRLLQRAKQLYEVSPMSGEDLLERLRSEEADNEGPMDA